MQSAIPKSSRIFGLLMVSLIALAACGGGGAGNGIASLGSVFTAAFGQDANDAPLDITNANLQVDLTAEPFEL